MTFHSTHAAAPGIVCETAVPVTPGCVFQFTVACAQVALLRYTSIVRAASTVAAYNRSFAADIVQLDGIVGSVNLTSARRFWRSPATSP